MLQKFYYIFGIQICILILTYPDPSSQMDTDTSDSRFVSLIVWRIDFIIFCQVFRLFCFVFNGQWMGDIRTQAINIFSTNYLMFSILNMFQAAGGLGMHTILQ